MSNDRAWFATPPHMAGGVRLLLTIGILGQLFALLLLLTSWNLYQRPLVALTMWVALGLAVAGLAAAGHLAGRQLGSAVAAGVVGVIVATDVLVPLSVHRGQDVLGAAGWNWGAAALVLLGLGIYRPMAEVMGLGVLHAAGALLWGVSGYGPLDPVSATMAISGALIPPVGAVQFLSSFQVVVAAREQAVAREQALRAERAATEAIQDDTDRRLAALRGEGLPFLRSVADGSAPLPLTAAGRDTARRVAEHLRHELVRGREVDWLLQSRLAPASAGPDSGPEEIEVRVITGRGTVAMLEDEDRAAIGALVALLRKHPGWLEMTLSVAGGAGERPALALVARGAAAGPAHADPGVRSAVERLRGAAALEDAGTLVVQA